MKTYQDLLECGENEDNRMEFVRSTINSFTGSPEYRLAIDGELYLSGRNSTIEKYQKFLRTKTGKLIEDTISPNHKNKSGFFKRFIIQRCAYLLGNGVILTDKGGEQLSTADILGKKFDKDMYFYAKKSLAQAAAYGFYNLDHVDWFKFTEFVPLYDEEDGAMKAGVRFWQLAPDKPRRVTLYELDGYTDYIENFKRRSDENEKPFYVLHEKRKYKRDYVVSAAEGKIYTDGSNYDGFPIVPLYANEERQSELIGIREQIDCYDLIKSGFANDLDEAKLFWILKNCGGLDSEIDLIKFREQMRMFKAATLDDGMDVTAQTLEIPYQSREVYLALLKKDLYEDAMALNTEQIAAGNVTATQINAAYEPLNEITDEFEYRCIDFVEGLLKLAGIDATVKFNRSIMKNQAEETQMVLSAGTVLDEDTLIEKLPFLSSDEVKTVKERRSAEDLSYFSGNTPTREEVRYEQEEKEPTSPTVRVSEMPNDVDKL